MTNLELKITKAELLCYGLRIDNSSISYILTYNPYAIENTLVHALNIVIENTFVCVCVAENFCKLSPYYLKYEKGLFLYKNSKRISEVQIVSCPTWCNDRIDGYRIGEILRPHSDLCISCSPILKCGYHEIGKTCLFCSMNGYASQYGLTDIINPLVLSKMISRALEYKEYDLNFSAGTLLHEDETAKYYIEVLRELRKSSNNKCRHISIEISPPNKDEYIRSLADAGVTSLIMNIEIADEYLRKKICPGKSEISLKRYLEALKLAVEIFGKGNVASVLIAGIQPTEDIINMGKQLIQIGVIPTIMPFKPLNDCVLNKKKVTDPYELLFINSILENQLAINGIDPNKQHGCVLCGGCSLETESINV